MFDIDEMFVPTENRKWREVMEELIREPQIIIPEKAVGFKNYRSQYYEEKERNARNMWFLLFYSDLVCACVNDFLCV